MIRDKIMWSWITFFVNIFRIYQPETLCLFETKMTIEKAIHRLYILGFPNSMGVDADGFAGGIWLGWKTNVDLSAKAYCKN